MTALSADERQELAQSVRSACERLAPEDRVRAVAYGEGDGAAADATLRLRHCAMGRAVQPGGGGRHRAARAPRRRRLRRVGVGSGRP